MPPDPISVAGLALSAVSVAAQTFNGCITGLRTISKARSSHVTLLSFRTQLDLEIARLLIWGRNSGLARDELHESLQPIQPLLLDILGNIASSIESTDKLKSAYGIELLEEDASEAGRTPSPRPAGTVESLDLLPNSGLAPELQRQQSIASGLRKKTHWYRRVKWAAWDEAKATHFIDAISGYVTSLNRLLTESQQTAYEEEFTALKIAILGTNWAQRGSMLGALHSATVSRYESISMPARLARLRLEFEMEEIAPSPPAVGGLPALSLPISHDGLHTLDPSRSCTRFGNSRVVIEWKTPGSMESTGEPGRRLMEQAVKLATLFQALHSQPGVYRVLECVGYVDHRHNIPPRYGLAFALPPTCSSQTPFHTLHEYLSSREHEDFQPSLGSRFELARQLAKAFLQFHQLGWLHKGICSHNIIFFPRDGLDSIESPYILGFDYSRPNSQAGISDKPNSDPKFDLYRHPDCQGEPPASFQLRFDIFSIGLLLFEIAKWRPLSNYRARMGGARITPSAFVDGIIDDVNADLEFRMGVHFKEAVLICLQGSFGIDGEDPLDKRLKLAFFEKVVKQLNNCHA
ncbi:hypothetical protein K440DRAFT_629819 [Wilcoxina mikolae CBS 423.85]|nr:hypothetical protein K440DRAFT_629819 [Wilcoxina mikolae CBS 423.85]